MTEAPTVPQLPQPVRQKAPWWIGYLLMALGLSLWLVNSAVDDEIASAWLSGAQLCCLGLQVTLLPLMVRQDSRYRRQWLASMKAQTLFLEHATAALEYERARATLLSKIRQRASAYAMQKAEMN